MTSPDKREPFAELARERFEQWAKTPREDGCYWEPWAFERMESGHYEGASVETAWQAWQAAQPTPEQKAQAARQIAINCVDLPYDEFVIKAEQILNDTFKG